MNPFWTLFLDRDGVINTELTGDYVKSWDEFQFEENALDALEVLHQFFAKMVIVTNQRGVGAGIMSREDLDGIHDKMLTEMTKRGIRIDAIYAVTDADRNSSRRKPNPYMGLLAKEEFPDIDLGKSLIAGNSKSDMEFGKRLGIKTAFIDDKKAFMESEKVDFADYKAESLFDLAGQLQSGRIKLY